MRKYNISDITELQKASETIESDGLKILLKKIPGVTKAGYLDPYEKACQEDNWVAQQRETGTGDTKNAIEAIRESMGFPNYNLNQTEIYIGHEILEVEGRKVGLWRYYKRRTSSRRRPALVYIHGGGWIGGTVFTVENPCRLIAELADAIVFNVEYSLAPEHPFPAGFNDCYAAVSHIYEHADDYGIDASRIAVAGDSAGGNLTAAICLKAREEGKQMVAEQILLYPSLTSQNEGIPGYEWRPDVYDIAPGNEEEIRPLLCLGNGTNPEKELMIDAYLPDRSLAADPLVSPMMAENHAGLPKALIAVAEFDGLRQQGEFYGRQLEQAGVAVRTLRYCGASHAFIDRLGYVPSAEDICIEIANDLKKL